MLIQKIVSNKEKKRVFWLINEKGGSHCRILRMDDSRRCKTGQNRGNNAKPGKTADTPGDAKESKQHYTRIQTKKQVKSSIFIIVSINTAISTQRIKKVKIWRSSFSLSIYMLKMGRS